MNDQFRQMLIEKLQKGDDIPADWERELFPPEKREYELVYHGKEREEDILAETMAAPLQPVRTFGKNGGDWHNMLIFGDNLQAMKTLREMKKEGKLCNADGSQGIRLVYIDPPFASRREYSGTQEEKAYQDKIIGAQFIEFLRKRLILIRELLAPRWSVYVHLDEKKSHYIKAICDEVFGEQRFQREIVWRIGWLSGYKTKAKNWIRNHDVILFYSDRNCIFNKKYIPYSKGYTRRDGSPPTGKGYPIEDTWNCNEIDRLDSIQIMSFSGEKTGFPTQKNENLSERIINASSARGDIVLDAFAGSGTTCAIAEKLERRWIAIDCGKLSIYTIQKRMLNLKKEIGNKGKQLKPKPFTLYNAGLYDFSSLRNLPWKDWRFFALQLFGCKDEPHEIGGLALDGKLKGASVLVFDHHQDKKKTVDEGTIESIHSAVGKTVGNRFFIIAPRAVFDFQQDYIDLDNVRYYALRIPYSIIHELHRREFSALKQPNDEMAVNDTVDAVGFDFIQPPEVQWMAGRRKSKKKEDAEAYLTLKKFESRAKIKGKERKGGFETFSMLMLDFDYDGDVFDFDQVFYAQELEHSKWKATFPAKSLGKNIMAVFIDIYGNEARELIPVSAFKSSKQ